MYEGLKVAVYLDENNYSTALTKPGVIRIFTKAYEQWVSDCDIRFDIQKISSIKELRESFIEAVKSLGDCKIFAAAEIKGVPLTILENLSFSIWEVFGTPEEFLDKIAQECNNPTVDTYILDKGDGCYSVDLKAVMDRSEKITSKQILLPFFKETKFQLLEVACSHIPPWFEQELEKFNLKMEATQVAADGFVAKIFPN